MTALNAADHASTQTRTPERDPWRITAVALLPILVLGLLLAALWNPMDRLDTVKAAIVNLDEPVEVDGQVVPLGRQLAAGLVSGGGSDAAEGPDAVPPSGTNYAWELTDAEGAEAGLADGTYAAVVTVPEDFSAAATSFGGDDAGAARQATIDVETPPGSRVVDDALAKIVATTATSVMSSALTETYVDNVLIGFGDLAEGIGEAADGASQLAEGAGDAADGATQLAGGAGQLADGASEASSGAAQLAGGASQLAGGARDAASGASDLADGADQVAGGMVRLAGGVSLSADGADRLSGGADQLADGAGELAGGADQLARELARLDERSEALPSGAAQLTDGSAGIAAGLQQYIDGATAAYGCDADFDNSAECAGLLPLVQLQASAATVAGGWAELTGEPGTPPSDPTGLYALQGGIGQLAGGAAELAGGTDGLVSGAEELAAGTGDLAEGLGQLDAAAGQLATGASGIATGASELADGVGQLSAGASGVATGASGLADGVGRLGTGADDLSDGAGELADGVDQLAGGAGDLSDGLEDATEQIPAYADGERQNLAAVVAEPVAAPGVDDLSTGATGPLFAAVALWLGALGLLTVFPPVARRALGSTRGSLRLALEVFRVPALVGLATGAVVGGILAVVEDVSIVGAVGAVVVGALASVCFVAVHQGFLGWLGHAGRGISLLIAVLLIGTGVVATVPGLLAGLTDLLPTGAARDALLAVVVPGAGGIAGALTWLVLWTLVGLALAVGAAARSRRTRVAALLRA